MKHILIAATVFLISLTSCHSFKKYPTHEERISLSTNNLSELNGRYEIITIDSSFNTLDYALLVKSPFHLGNIPENGDYVLIQVLTNKKIKVSSYENGEMYHSKILIGKIKNNNFVFRTQYTFPIFTLVLNGLSFQKTRIGLLENKNLTLDSKGGGIAFIGFFPIAGGSSDYCKHIFKKIN